MTDLKQSHRVILENAARRPAGPVLPLPDGLGLRGGALKATLAALIKRGLVAERPARTGEAGWREDKDGAKLTLRMTPDGRAAVKANGAPVPVETPRKKRSRKQGAPHRKARMATTAPLPGGHDTLARPGTKLALLVDLLSRPTGATVSEVQHATGWQPHTVRAAITGLKKKGLSIVSEKPADGPRAYRITSPDGGKAKKGRR